MTQVGSSDDAKCSFNLDDYCLSSLTLSFYISITNYICHAFLLTLYSLIIVLGVSTQVSSVLHQVASTLALTIRMPFDQRCFYWLNLPLTLISIVQVFMNVLNFEDKHKCERMFQVVERSLSEIIEAFVTSIPSCYKVLELGN